MKKLLNLLVCSLSAIMLNAQTLNWQITEHHIAKGAENKCGGVAIDSKGNTIMAYNISINDTVSYIAINKYNKSGLAIGTVYHARNESTFLDNVNKLIVDNNNNIYIQGTLTNYNGLGYVSVIMKYNENLVFQWERVIEKYGIPYFYSYPVDMEIDTSGNVYSLCYARDTIYNLINGRYKVVKYAASGTKLYETNIQNIGSHIRPTYILDLATDYLGNAIVYGTSVDTTNAQPYAITIKYSPTGLQTWAKKYFIPVSTSINGGYANHCITDAQGNIYISGYAGFASPNSRTNAYLIKYSPAGIKLWGKTEAEYSAANTSQALVCDSAANIYHVIQISCMNNTSYMIKKYNTAGKLLSACPLIFEKLIDFKVSPGGNAYALGGFVNRYTNYGISDPEIVKFNTALQFEYVTSYYSNVYANTYLEDLPAAIALNRKNGEVAVAGEYYADSTGGNTNGFTIVNYKNEVMARPASFGSDEYCTDAKNMLNDMPATDLVISPNPATDFIVVDKKESSLIEIYNADGQLVKSVQPKNNFDMQFDVSQLQAGVYMVRATTADGYTTGKFVKQKTH